jgi:hypothetical protein
MQDRIDKKESKQMEISLLAAEGLWLQGAEYALLL